ncbi:hypothetical protein A3K64_02230 [Candidatus Micrarchaeota archaeon RBG_16_36_9]|nr:MAG: hypothetical protein A3K64_02230 [Candidatus Micrarchaeota archaeon RBG_16_36_9]
MKKTLSKKSYLVGVTDSEGCFSISTKKQNDTKFGWVLDPLFQVTQHSTNRIILEMFESELRCGRIIEKPGQEDILVYIVDNRRQLKEKVIPFFEENKLIAKQKDFEIFKEVVEALERKEHQDKEKFKKLVEKVFKMNLNGKQRHYELSEILRQINEVGSSETIRQTP